MIDNDWQDNAVSFFQRLLPLVTAVLMALSSYIPVYIGIISNIRPDMGMIAIYFWMLHRGDLFDLKSVVLLGLIDGALGTTALGMSLFAYLVVYVLMTNLRKFLNGRPFVVVWYGFMAVSLVAILLKWLVATIYWGKFLSMTSLMFSYFLGAAVYPVMSMVLAFVQNCFLQDDEL